MWFWLISASFPSWIDWNHICQLKDLLNWLSCSFTNRYMLLWIHQRSCEINIVMCCAASMAIVFNIFCEIKRKSKTNLQPIYLMNFADFLIKSILIIWQFAKSIRYLNANGLLLNDRLQFEAIFSCKSPARV